MTGLPPRPDIPLSLPRSFHAEARELRNKLLSYRFRNFSRERELESLHDRSVEARISQVFAPLLAVVNDEGARIRIAQYASGKSGLLHAERSASVEAQLLDIIYDMRRDACDLRVKDIALRFEERYGADFQRPITARWIGGQLRTRLSLVPVKVHGSFVIARTDNLPSLFERYGVGDEVMDVGTLGMSRGRSAEEPF